MKVNKKEKAFSSINTRSFITVMILLLIILAVSGALSYFIPQGHFLRDDNGAIIPGTFSLGDVEGIAIWRVFTAPFRVFASEDSLTIIMISVFLLIMSGVFNLMEKTGGIRVFIGRIVKRFSNRKNLVICVAVLAFMAFGSFFGMFEELITLLPIVIIFMLSLGFDTLTGLGVCLIAACFGFSSAITNPFSVGLASEIAGVQIFDGVWLRICFFVFIYSAVCVFILLHIRKITKNPKKSLTYAIDKEKLANLDTSVIAEDASENKTFKVFSVFFVVQLVFLVLIASINAISGFAIPILALTFLLGGIISGLFVCENKKDIFAYIGKGALAMLPAVAMIAVASSVKLVMTESNIIDTIMNSVINALSGKSKFVCILLIYFLILFLQVFIGSASAKLMLIMPIMVPICTQLGISPTLIILTYCIADGFTDVILPTNPVLLIGLSMANVSYGKWVRFTWPLQLFVFLSTVGILWFATSIGY